MRFKVNRYGFANCQNPIPSLASPIHRKGEYETIGWYIDINNLNELEALSNKYGIIEIDFIDKTLKLRQYRKEK
jgi:uncharacterized protein with von Willebrand factor type A (vWA) domain